MTYLFQCLEAEKELRMKNIPRWKGYCFLVAGNVSRSIHGISEMEKFETV
jgi:hypothetical protein